jgi:hypothetical protein
VKNDPIKLTDPRGLCPCGQHAEFDANAFSSTTGELLPDDLVGDLAFPGESNIMIGYDGAVVIGASIGSWHCVADGPDYNPLVWNPGKGYSQGESANESAEDNYYATHTP